MNLLSRYLMRTIILSTALVLAVCSLSAQVRYEDIREAPSEDWLTFMGDYAANRHSPLDEITRDNLNVHLLDLWARTRPTIIFVTHSIPEAVFLSSRIVVMSPRPGRILRIIDSDLPPERDLDVRETSRFLEIAHEVRLALREGHSYD